MSQEFLRIPQKELIRDADKGLYTRMCVSLLMEVLNLGRSYKFRNMGLFKEITLSVLDTVFNDESDIRLQLQSHCDKRDVCLENTWERKRPKC